MKVASYNIHKAVGLDRRRYSDRILSVAARDRTRAGGIGWHGNVLLVRRGIEVISAAPVPLPTIEPRGAVCAELRVADRDSAGVP